MSINVIDIAWYALQVPHCRVNKLLILKGLGARAGSEAVFMQVLAAPGEN
jgi:hypothetical protein